MRHFKSSLSILLKEYITYRCSLGYTESNLRPWLYSFDRYVCDKEADLGCGTFLDMLICRSVPSHLFRDIH